MKYQGTLEVTLPSDREIMVRRKFDAPRRLVFEVLTKPEFMKEWLLGPTGWEMPTCVFELRAGGKYRYVWRRTSDGFEMGAGGDVREFVPPTRIVVTERFDEAWYPGEALITQTLDEENGVTTLTMMILYESREARDVALKTDMAKGMTASYDRLSRTVARLGERR